jgi:hypothetical protein
MKTTIKIAAAALVLFASAPAFAHGGGMGHMGGNMGTNMSGNMGGNMGHSTGTMSKPTVIGDHGDHHTHLRFTKTTDRTHTRLHTVKFRKVVRIEREIRRLRFELIKLKLEGRSNTFEARQLLFRVVALNKLINS